MKRKNLRRIVDIGLTILLLLQMAYQVMGEAAHEWLGMGMTALVIVHQILNRRWYGTLLRGRYAAYRVASTCVNALLLENVAMLLFWAFAGWQAALLLRGKGNWRRPLLLILAAAIIGIALNAAAGLTPAYEIDGESVTRNRAADGYRLPTEAEWEYACRGHGHALQPGALAGRQRRQLLRPLSL